MTLAISTSAIMYVNQVYSLKFSVTIVDFINNNNTFLIIYPSGSIVNYTTSTTQITISNIQLINSTNLTFSQPQTPARINSPTTVLNFTFGNYTAPPSTTPTANFSFCILRGGSISQIGYASVQATASSLSFTVVPIVGTINQNTTYQFAITITDGITSSGSILIIFPNSITLGFTSANCATMSGTLFNPTPTCSKSGNNLHLSNLNSSTNGFASTTFQINVSGIINPSSTQPTTNFTITTLYSSTNNGIVSTNSNVTITPTAGIMNSSLASITSSSYLVGNSGVTYTFSFNIANQIPIGGYIIVSIPTVIGMAIGSVSSFCYVQLPSNSFTPATCTGISNANFYTVTFTGLFSISSIS
jgi:hypothetical protein